MALTPNFSATQTLGSPSIITLTDTSTGTDVLVTKRRVYLAKADGTYLVPDGTTTDYVEWNDFPATTSIDIDCLDKDYALNITVQWLNVSSTVLYTKTTLVLVTLYNETFTFSLVQGQRSNPLLMSNVNYRFNQSALRVEIDNATTAVNTWGDIDAAQSCLDRAKAISDNIQNFF